MTIFEETFSTLFNDFKARGLGSIKPTPPMACYLLSSMSQMLILGLNYGLD